MKKVLLLLLFPLVVFASSADFEAKIYRIILDALFPSYKTVKIWTDNPEKRGVFFHLGKATVVASPKEADILILSKKETKLPNKMVFVTQYPLFSFYKNQVIGGFYWKKGRPNILFIRKNLDKYHIQLPQSLQKYIVERP